MKLWLSLLTPWGSLRRSVKWKRPVTKDDTLQDPIYMKHQEWTDAYRQRLVIAWDGSSWWDAWSAFPKAGFLWVWEYPAADSGKGCTALNLLSLTASCGA